MEVDASATPTERRAAQIEAHKKHLDSEYQRLSKIWNSSTTEHRTASDALDKYEQAANVHRRKTGQTCYNGDGSLAFLAGFAGESHLRSIPEILRELGRYCQNDMLRLRQSRVENLLHEVLDTANNEILIGKFEINSPEYTQLRQNTWCIQNAITQITRRNGIPPSKAHMVRCLVRTILTLKPFTFEFGFNIPFRLT